jgi:hypothetical protein
MWVTCKWAIAQLSKHLQTGVKWIATRATGRREDMAAPSASQVAENAGKRLVTINISNNVNVPMRDNKVANTKYTLLTFLPKNLMEQFRYERAVNWSSDGFPVSLHVSGLVGQTVWLPPA